VRSEILTATTIKKTVVRDMTPYCMVEIYPRVSWVLMMEAAGSSGTSVNFYQTTLRHISEDRSSVLRRKCHGTCTACEIFTR
jgi:hypothetical protein